MVIDARTPAEYALDHIPGAVSAPVLDDAERAEVGTLYKHVSPFEAKKLGAALEAQLDCLTALHGKEKISQWKALAAKGEWREFVTRLLREHYDPAYQRSSTRNFPELANAPTIGIANANAFDAAAAEFRTKYEISSARPALQKLRT